MKISKEDVIKNIELYYNILSDEIALLESRINTLVGICGVLIVFVSGLLAYISLKPSSPLILFSKCSFGAFIILSFVVIILAIITIYPRTANSESIKEDSTGIKWGSKLKIVKFGDYADYLLSRSNTDSIEEFIKETYVKSLWGKELLKRKRIELSKYTMIIFLIATLCLVMGGLSLLLSF